MFFYCMSLEEKERYFFVHAINHKNTVWFGLHFITATDVFTNVIYLSSSKKASSSSGEEEVACA